MLIFRSGSVRWTRRRRATRVAAIRRARLVAWSRSCCLSWPNRMALRALWTGKLPRSGGGRHARHAVINRSQQIVLGARTSLVLHLHWRSRHVRLTGSLLLLGIGLRSYATRTAIKAGPRHCASHHRPAVHIADLRGADVHYGSVVKEMAPIPVATLKAVAAKPEAVIDAAVEADVRPPVAGVP